MPAFKIIAFAASAGRLKAISHLLVNPDLTLSHTEKVHFVRPSGDVLFESVAACFGPRAIPLILTGGVTLAQDEASSESFSMPRSAIKSGSVDHVLALDAIAPCCSHWWQRLNPSHKCKPAGYQIRVTP